MFWTVFSLCILLGLYRGFGGVVRVVWGYEPSFVDVVRGGECVSVGERVWDVLRVKSMCEVGLPFSIEF